MSGRLILTHILFFAASLCVQAQNQEFVHFTKSGSGLCYDGIKTIIQDSKGNVWAGTHMGLSCYDGNSFSSYYKADFGVDSDFISSLAEDLGGNIWIGTDCGIVIRDGKRGSFRSFGKSIINSRIYSMARDSKGEMWIGARKNGLYRSDGRKLQIVQGTENLSNVYRIAIDGQDRIFLAAYCDDLYCYSEDKLEVVGDGYFHGDNIEGITFDRLNDSPSLYIASKRNGLCRLDIASGEVVSLYEVPEGHRPVAISGRNGLIWLSTTGGLVRYDTQSGEGTLLTSDKKNPLSLSDDYVTTTLPDRSGALWAGTNSRGINYSSPYGERFRKYWKLADGTGLEYCNVKGFAEDSDGNVWIATEKLGLLHLKPDGVLEKAPFGNLPNNITGVCIDGSLLWAGSHNGIYSIELKSRKVTYNPNFGDKAGQTDNRIISMYRNTRGELYIGTPVGIMLLNRSDGRFYPIPALRGITAEQMIEDGLGNIWIASYAQGAFLYSPSDNQLRRFCVQADTPPVHEMTSALELDPNGNIWIIGFSSGFYKFNKDIDNFEAINMAVNPALPTDLYLGARADNKGRLWLSSDAGLIEYDIRSGGVAVFGPSDGILPSEIKKSALRLSDGSLLFGFTGGIMRFLPSDFANPPAPSEALANKDFWTSTAGVILVVLIAAVILSILFFFIAYRRAMANEHRRQVDRDKAKDAELYNEKLEFFSNIIHEIKTPLTLIRTPLQNMISSGQLSPDQMADLQIIGNSTDYLDQLVKELLEFVSVQKHGYILDLHNIDIAERLRFVCYNFSETAKSANVKLTMEASPDIIVTAVDTRALNKIFNNLVHNAVKYCESFISINARTEADRVVISFVNDGPVIPAGRREAVFQPFVRYSDERQQYKQSFGIGLAQARTLAELHDGTLELSPRTDVNEFILTLPLRTVEETNVADTDAQATETSMAQLLIVEDNADLSYYLKRKLRKNYRVFTVPSAEKALDVLKGNKIDVLLTDIGLQSMSGVELCRMVSQDKDLSHIPIIVISAISSTETKIKCMENGATIYIEKPFSQDYLDACIKGVLSKRQAQKEAYGGVPYTPHAALQDRDEFFVRKLDKIIADNISNPGFSNKQIEEGLFVSRSSLNRKVRALLGMTPNEYVQKKRLAAAARLLEEGKSRINEVAYAVGFSSPSYFAKCFKAEYGMLPAEYMKSINK